MINTTISDDLMHLSHDFADVEFRPVASGDAKNLNQHLPDSLSVTKNNGRKVSRCTTQFETHDLNRVMVNAWTFKGGGSPGVNHSG